MMRSIKVTYLWIGGESGRPLNIPYPNYYLRALTLTQKNTVHLRSLRDYYQPYLTKGGAPQLTGQFGNIGTFAHILKYDF